MPPLRDVLIYAVLLLHPAWFIARWGWGLEAPIENGGTEITALFIEAIALCFLAQGLLPPVPDLEAGPIIELPRDVLPSGFRTQFAEAVERQTSASRAHRGALWSSVGLALVGYLLTPEPVGYPLFGSLLLAVIYFLPIGVAMLAVSWAHVALTSVSFELEGRVLRTKDGNLAISTSPTFHAVHGGMVVSSGEEQLTVRGTGPHLRWLKGQLEALTDGGTPDEVPSLLHLTRERA